MWPPVRNSANHTTLHYIKILLSLLQFYCFFIINEYTIYKCLPTQRALGTLTTNYTIYAIYSASLRRGHLAHGLQRIQCSILFSSILRVLSAVLLVEVRVSCLIHFHCSSQLMDQLLSFSDVVSGSEVLCFQHLSLVCDLQTARLQTNSRTSDELGEGF